MDNTLKCRVWDKTTKTMHYNDFVITSTGFIAELERSKSDGLDILQINQKFVEFEKDKVSMKCTGLEDKNGNLIYCGDILQETYNSDGEVATDITFVEWFEDGASFVMVHAGYEDNESDFTYFNEYDVDLNNYEIIGNKYENPELLKAE